jgi:HEAT repeat protein
VRTAVDSDGTVNTTTCVSGMTRALAVALSASALSAAAIVFACRSEAPAPRVMKEPTQISTTAESDLGTRAHLDRVMTSASCGRCHSAIYAEHRQNTHGMAFTDTETRLATRNFRREDCIRCHTPRPVFETGIGMTPMQRWTDLEEGNTCMSCHWKQDYDYSRFIGGAECKTAFDPRVGTVQACSSCHRIGGTPDQWSRAEHGRKAGNVCIDCHMPLVDRPVADGEPPRPVYSHVFPASRSESQLRRAYAYEAKIEGSQVVVRIKNKGAGHSLPTATRQRSFESLVTVRDRDGNVIGSSRLVCRYPYASELASGQLTMPVSTQIPSGQTREHRVPIPIASGTVECSLFFKRYRPIADFDPGLSRRLEHRVIAIDIAEPSTEPIRDAPEVGIAVPPGDLHDFFDPQGVTSVARPDPSPQPIEIPEGRTPAELERLVSLLEFHMPEARRLARERLRSIGPAAYPVLIDALGAWSNETFNQAIEVLASIGEPALPAVRAALRRPELYVRCHARKVIARMMPTVDREAVVEELASALRMPHPVDRRSAAEALGSLGDRSVAEALVACLSDVDVDVVIAAARALARLQIRDAVPAIERAFLESDQLESKRDLALALAELGSGAGVPVLIEGLDQSDDVIRESFFEGLFSVTGLHFGYEMHAPREERLEAIARWQSFWAQSGNASLLQRPRRVEQLVHEHALGLVIRLGGGSDTEPGGDDRSLLDELAGMKSDALPALIEGLTFPSGYPEKRALVCQALARLGDKDAAPFLAEALRDPVLSVSDAACAALESTHDAEVLPALSRYQARLLALQTDPARASSVGPLLARAARTSLLLGDDRAREVLTGLLLSSDRATREFAIEALEQRYGDRRGFDPDSSTERRAAAVLRWAR